MSTSHTPHVEEAALNVGVHIAIEEVHTPRGTGRASVGSSRPVVAQLNIAKGMAARQGRVSLCRIYQACQFLNRREPPSFATTHRFLIGIANSINPSSRCCIRRFFPHKPCLLIKHSGIVQYQLKSRRCRQFLVPRRWNENSRCYFPRTSPSTATCKF